MSTKRNTKRIVAAAITIAGLTGGVMAVHADTFSVAATRPSQDLSTGVTPPTWPSVTPTCATSPCSINLYAGIGSVDVKDTVNGGVPGVVHVPFLGFGVNSGTTVDLAGAKISTIKVPVGTTMMIHLTAASTVELPDLSFPSLKAGDVTPQGGGSYKVIASTVGTSVFQPGTNPAAPRQIARGLVGVLIVTPKDSGGLDCTNCAYDASATATRYNDEAIVATTDLDYALANAADPTAFDMSYFGQPRDANDQPRQVYHVINGKSFPDTDVIDVHAGDNVLLRYVNAGVADKSIGLLGLRQSLLARNASEYTDAQTLIAPLIGPGETADVAVTVPTGAPAGQRFSLADQGRQMNHGTASGYGGALTFLNVWTGTAPVVVAPVVVPPVVVPPVVVPVPPTVTASYVLATQQLSGTATPSSPGAPVNLVEYSTDNVTWATLSSAAPITAFSGTVALTAPGTIYVRVTDSNTLQATTNVVVAPAAPTVSGVTAAGGGEIAATATPASGLTVAAAEYFVGATDLGAGNNTVLTVGTTGPGYALVSVGATLTTGDVVSIRAKDSFGQWGLVTPFTVT